MTENEKYLEMPWSIEDTIENLKTIKEHFIATVLKANLDGKGKQDAKEVEFDFNRAIKALEEIQQYRAIGTVEELKSMKENGAFTGVELAQLAAMQMRLKEYSAIGTIEEFKALKEKMQDVEIMIIERMQEFYDEYRSISQSRVDHFGGKADAIETSQQIVKGAFKDVLGIDWQ